MKNEIVDYPMHNVYLRILTCIIEADRPLTSKEISDLYYKLFNRRLSEKDIRLYCTDLHIRDIIDFKNRKYSVNFSHSLFKKIKQHLDFIEDFTTPKEKEFVKKLFMDMTNERPQFHEHLKIIASVLLKEFEHKPLHYKKKSKLDKTCEAEIEEIEEIEEELMDVEKKLEEMNK